METSELEMTPPDSPKATKEKKDAPAPEEDLLADLFPTAPPRDRSSIFYDREYWSNYKTPGQRVADGTPTGNYARLRVQALAKTLEAPGSRRHA